MTCYTSRTGYVFMTRPVASKKQLILPVMLLTSMNMYIKGLMMCGIIELGAPSLRMAHVKANLIFQ